MDKTYADTVRLLLAVAPDVFANDIFALKGGTGINLFMQDMPRLSVDIDIVQPSGFVGLRSGRSEVQGHGLGARCHRSDDAHGAAMRHAGAYADGVGSDAASE